MEAELTSPVKPSTAVARTIPCIRGLNPEFQVKAQKHLDSLTKPLGSLGQLEAVAAQYVAWREEGAPNQGAIGEQGRNGLNGLLILDPDSVRLKRQDDRQIG